MHSKFRKLIAVLAAPFLIATALLAVTPAQATSCAGTNVRLSSPAAVERTNAYDATSWVAQYLSAGSKAYVMYYDAGSTNTYTYRVTDGCGAPVSGAQVSLKVNTNWSCSNATFLYGQQAISPDWCNGGGQTQLAAQTSDSSGIVSFTLVNTNDPTAAEDRPAHIYDDPTGHNSPIKTDIRPYIDGSEDVDVLFAHFITPLGVQCTDNGHRNIRIVSPNITPGVNAFDASSWGNGWANPGSGIYIQYLTAGHDFTLTYSVTDNCGATVSGQSVGLKVNLNWSGSNATFTSGSQVIGAEYGNGGQNGGPGESVLPSQISDSNGQVTFSLRNTNNPSTAEPSPSTLFEDPTNHVNQVKTSIQPFISGMPSATTDYYWAHFVIDPDWHAPVCIPTKTKQVRFLNPKMVIGSNAYDATNWIAAVSNPGTRAFLQYVHAGSDMTLTYIVTDNCGAPFANVPVSLKVNANWSCSNATFTAGGVAIGPDYCNGQGQTVLPAQNTDGGGLVTFHLTNTNNPATAEPAPSNIAAPPSDAVVAAKQQVGTNIQPYIDGTESTDWYFAHFTRDPKVQVTVSGTVAKGSRTKVSLQVMGSNAKPLANAKVWVKLTGSGSIAASNLATDGSGYWAVTNGDGVANINFQAGDTGSATVTATYADGTGFSTTGSASINVVDQVQTVASTNAVAGTGYASFTVTNAGGKLVSVVLNGSKRVYRFFPRKASETYSIKAPAGVNTLTVYIGGKATTYKVTVK